MHTDVAVLVKGIVRCLVLPWTVGGVHRESSSQGNRASRKPWPLATPRVLPRNGVYAGEMIEQSRLGILTYQHTFWAVEFLFVKERDGGAS
jgi:hypothetical protein